MNRLMVHSMDKQSQTDLLDFDRLQKHNSGCQYFLVCINILSKYAWAIPSKTKRVGEIQSPIRKCLLRFKPNMWMLCIFEYKITHYKEKNARVCIIIFMRNKLKNNTHSMKLSFVIISISPVKQWTCGMSLSGLCLTA